MEEAPENGKESSHSARAKGMNESMNEASSSVHYHVEINALICLIKKLYEIYSEDSVYISRHPKLCHFATGIFASKHRHFSNNTYVPIICSEPAVTTHHQLINQEAFYTSYCVTVDLNFNSQVFHCTQDFPLGQHVPHSMLPTLHHL
jgi:hypothetical protein